MNTLSRDDIVSVCDLSPKLMDVPEWGGSVFISQLSAAGRMSVDELLLPEEGEKPKGIEAITLFLCRVLVDADNHLLFEDEEAPLLAEKDFEVLLRIHETATAYNGMGAKAAEDLEKN